MDPYQPETAAELQALGLFAAALAQFQSTRPTAYSASMEDVLVAVGPAHDLGFAYCVRSDHEDTIVQLLHSGGWFITSASPPDGEWWWTLSDLLGIVACEPTQPTTAEQPAPSPPAEPTPPPTPEPPEVPEDVDPIGPGTPDTPTLPEDREQLSDADRETCLAMIRAITPEQRKSFTVAFRSHFNVDKSARAISPHIVQVMHKKFIETFVDELELSGETA